MAQQDRFIIRFDPGLKPRIAAQAEAGRHSLNGEINILLAEALAARAERKEPGMSATTSYGNWGAVERFTLTVAGSVAEALGEQGGDYDLEAIAAAWRAAINEALPPGVTLAGDEFYGPHPARAFDGWPVTEDGGLDIKAVVEGVDFWAIAEAHSKEG